MMDLCNSAVVRGLMAEAGIAPRKGFGQNFLIDARVPEEIAERCADDADRLILEIGPGIGCLTQELAQRYARVIAVEIDRGLIPVLDRTRSDFDNVRVINEDIMRLDLRSLVAEAAGKPISVCANLPYYITTPILMHLLESGIAFDTITVMIQSEVATRLCAAAGDAEYGAITAVLGYYGQVRRLFTVSPGSFLPPPKVTSTVVRIDLYRDKPCKPRNEALFFKVIRAAFEQRRKTLVNALAAKFPVDKERLTAVIVAAGHPATVRGERLTTAQFCALSDALDDILSAQ